MQNFEIIVVDDQATLAAIGRVRAQSEAFVGRTTPSSPSVRRS